MSTIPKPPLLLDLGGVVFGNRGTQSVSIDWDIIMELNHKFDGLSLGSATLAQYLDEYNQRTKQTLSHTQFLDNIWDTIHFNQPLLDWLYPRYAIYILSDNYRENIEYVTERFQLSRWTSGAYYSFQYGMTKADPMIFKHVVAEIGLPVSDFVFVDDSQYKIDAAASIGLKSILYTSNTELFAALQGAPDTPISKH
ncbi:MAG: HAD-IA family hydrolase [Saprospiraceae bacterium]|nr:HAD-IA family hydrolase [Saprospiraceae bacterium]